MAEGTGAAPSRRFKEGIMKKLAVMLILAMATWALAASKTVTTQVTRIKSGGASVYNGEEDDAKKIELNAGDEVTLLKQGKSRSMVRTSGNVKGWVNNG